jgi:hypothetical protein
MAAIRVGPYPLSDATVADVQEKLAAGLFLNSRLINA